MNRRRPELDWLRVVAIAILHAFHVGMMFNRRDFHRGEIIQLHAVVRFDALSHGDAFAELDDGSSVIVSRTHRDTFLTRWRGR